MKYLCYMCGLWVGDESEPQGPSQPCPACRKTMENRRRDPTRYTDWRKNGAGWKEPR